MSVVSPTGGLDFARQSWRAKKNIASTGETSLQNLGRDAGGDAADSPTLAGFLRGYQFALLIAAAVAFVGALISLWPARRDDSDGLH